MTTDYRRRIYDRYVSAFKRTDAPNRGRSFAAWCAENYLPLLGDFGREAEVLELGCGAGELLEVLRHAGFERARGIDASEEQVSLARRRGVDASVADALETLEQNPNTYDVVIAIDLIEHFTKRELFDLLDAAHSALRDRGRLLLRTPNGGALFGGHIMYGDLSHSTILSPSSLRQLLTLTGFDQVEVLSCPPARGSLRSRLRRVLWLATARVASMLYFIETGKRENVWTETMICGCVKPPA